jgi:parallel beta-helix repeat protein
MAIRTSCGTANIKFQFRRGTASQWRSSNPTLAIGEPGFETDTNGLKIGDGSTPWIFEGYAGNPAFVSVKDFGAVGDGNSKPLSNYFANLSAAQTYFPAATSLSDQLDWAAFSKAIQSNRTIFVPAGTYQFGANSLFIQGSNIKIHGTGQTSLITTSVLPNSSVNGMIQLGNCSNIVFEDIGFSSTSVYGSQLVDNFYGLVWSQNRNLLQIIFQRCYFTAPTANTNGIKIINENSQIADNIECIDCIFQDLGRMGVEFQNHNDAAPLARYRGFKSDRCVYKNIGLIANGMGVSLSGIGENCIISNNTFDNCRIGLELVGPNDTTVISNKFLNFPLANANIYDYPSNSGRPFSFTGARVMSGTRVIGNTTENPIPGSTYFWGQRDMILSNNILNHALQSWNSTRTYVPGETLPFSGTIYICLVTNSNRQPNTNPSFWATSNWSSTKTYASGEGVVYNGILYRSTIANNLNNIPPTNWSVSSIPVNVDFRNVQAIRATNEKYTTNTSNVVTVSDVWTGSVGVSSDNQFMNCIFDNTASSSNTSVFSCSANTNTTTDTNLIGCSLNKASGGVLYNSSSSGTGTAQPPVIYLAKHNTNTTLRGDLTFGNTVRVDSVWGDDTIAELTVSNGYTYPFRTVNAAMVALTSGKTMVILPGTYTLSSGITLPNDICIRGANVQTTILQMNVTASTTMITMGANCRVEDLTINLTCTGSTPNVVLKGIVFPDVAGQSTSQSSKLRTSVVSVRNSAMAKTLTSTITGIEFSGTGALTSSSFSFNSVKGSTINVYSNGAGNKRGILVSGTNQVSTRDTNIFVDKPTDTDSTGSYVGVETNSSGNGSIQLRSTTVGTVTSTVGDPTYTSSDILQTTPASLNDPTYLASPGIQIGPGTDLVTKTAGNKPFSTFIYPTTLYYGLKGDFKTGGSDVGYMWPGTQKTENNIFPDPDTTNPAFYRVQQPFLLSGIMCFMKLKAPGTHGGTTMTVSVWRTPFGGTIQPVDGFSLVFTGTDTFESYYNSSQRFGTKDLIHVKIECTNHNNTNAHDITVQLDCF